MTTLTYRGFPNFPTSQTMPRVPQRLVYRGLNHDGMSGRSARLKSAVQMSYRGVAYILTPNGRIITNRGMSEFATLGAAEA